MLSLFYFQLENALLSAPYPKYRCLCKLQPGLNGDEQEGQVEAQAR